MVATFVSKATIAGASDVFVSRKNAYGIMTGWGGISSDTPGVSSGPKRAFGIETIPSPVVPPTRVRRTYDDGPGRIYQFAGVQIPQGDMGFGIADLDLEAFAQGSQVWIRGKWKKNLLGLTAPIFHNMMVLTHSESVSEDTLTNGTPGFWNTLFGDVQLLPLGSPQHQAQQTTDVKYSAIYNPIVNYIDGKPFSSSLFDAANGTTIEWWSQYKTMFMTKIGDGTKLIPLDYTPVDAESTQVSVATISGGVVTVTDYVVESVDVAGKMVHTVLNLPSGSYVLCEYEALKLL